MAREQRRDGSHQYVDIDFDDVEITLDIIDFINYVPPKPNHWVVEVFNDV